MADIVVSEKKKVNIFDRVIQTVVIAVNMAKMNRAIDEHLNVIVKEEDEEKKEYEENILREIVFVKYQYDIMQRTMYDLRLNYSDEIINNINSSDKTERLNLQKVFLEMEYDRITKMKFRTKDGIKFYLLIISSLIEKVKQDIKDEGKNKKYKSLIEMANKLDTYIQTGEYEEKYYKEMFDIIDDYVSYINDNYDIARLPKDERELIEFVIETMINGINSDIDKHIYEYKLLINICKNAYRYFKIIDKSFEKIINIYNESLASNVMDIKDYIRMFKEVYDMKIKTKVNDVHRTIKTEDEYLEYSKLVTNFMYDELDTFILERALECSEDNKDVTKIINLKLGREVEEDVEEEKEEVGEEEEIKETLAQKIKKVAKKVTKKVIKDDKKSAKKVTKKDEDKKETKKTTKKKVTEKKKEDEDNKETKKLITEESANKKSEVKTDDKKILTLSDVINKKLE